jgi:hypothetical protein
MSHRLLVLAKLLSKLDSIILFSSCFPLRLGAFAGNILLRRTESKSEIFLRFPAKAPRRKGRHPEGFLS